MKSPEGADVGDTGPEDPDPHQPTAATADADEADDASAGGGDLAGQRRRRLLGLLNGAWREGPAPEPATPEPATPEPAVGVREAGWVGGRGSGLAGRLERLCELTRSEVVVDGAGVTVMSSLQAGLAGHRTQLAATGTLTRQLEQLQLTTGEGPCLDAFAAGFPVLVADINADTGRWLGFGPDALAAGARALFSLPLQVGAVRLGTLDLHRTHAEALSGEQLADALTLAALATEALLESTPYLDTGPDLDTGLDRDTGPDRDTGDPSGGTSHTNPHPNDQDLDQDPDQDPDRGHDRGPDAELWRSVSWLPDVHADVHVASGMVCEQARIDVATALLRLRGFAFSTGQPIHHVARRIIDRDLVLPDLPDLHEPRKPPDLPAPDQQPDLPESGDQRGPLAPDPENDEE